MLTYNVLKPVWNIGQFLNKMPGLIIFIIFFAVEIFNTYDTSILKF